jgi:ElaB/YqjD/DUF883 family membrane-anchored ribosome-binding protein
MLIGAGCAMFLSEKTGLTGLMSRAAADDKPRDAKARTAKTNGGSLAKGLKEGAHDVAGALGDGAAKVGEVAGGIADAVAHRVQSAVEGAGDQIAEASDRTKEHASKTARLLKDRADAFMQDQPLLAAAIGVAIGALMATAFPSTELEDEMMGETSDAVKETLGDAASEQLDAAKSAVAAVADQAKSAAEREGLTPAAAVDAARDLRQRFGRVVADTADAAATEVKERV